VARGSLTVPVGDVLCDTLVQPGAVVVCLIFREDGEQVPLAEDQRPIEDFAAQGADKAFAGCVHPGCLYGADQDSGAGCLEDGAERGSEV
jgi:hypothetical protein